MNTVKSFAEKKVQLAVSLPAKDLEAWIAFVGESGGAFNAFARLRKSYSFFAERTSVLDEVPGADDFLAKWLQESIEKNEGATAEKILELRRLLSLVKVEGNT